MRQFQKYAAKLSRSQWQQAFGTQKVKLLHTPFALSGAPMSRPDCVRYGNILALWACVIRDVVLGLRSKNVSGCELLSDCQIIEFIDNCATLDASELQDALKALLLSLRSVSSQRMSLSRIKQIFNSCELTKDAHVRSTVQWLVHLVRFVLRHGAGSDNALKGYVFTCVNTILQFTTRLTLNDCEATLEKSINDYRELESEMKTWTYDEQLVNELRGIVEKDLADIDLRATDSHGYGATKDVPRSEGTYAKWLSMQRNSGPQHQTVARLLGFTQHEKVENVHNALNRRMRRHGKVPVGLSVDERIVRFMLVPKGLTKKRGVSMEDTVNQYYQKMIFGVLDKHFQKHPEFGIYLHKQERNQVVAKIGSMNGLYGTFDLSSASDTVTWTLVKQLYGNTKIWPLLKLTRTGLVYLEDADETLTMEKAYGMGSACCFPIMSHILSAICRLANRKTGSRRVLQLVYGDDMVVHKSCCDLVAQMLKDLHFKLNRDKSYFPGSAFTESCGGEYYRGSVCDPLRISRKWDFVSFLLRSPKAQNAYRKHANQYRKICRDKRLTLTQGETLRDLANAAYDLKFQTLRKYCIDLYRQYYGKVFFSNDSRGFHSQEVQNQQWCSNMRRAGFDLQPMCRVRVLSTQTDRPKEAESLRLERWFECRYDSVSKAERLLAIVSDPKLRFPEYLSDKLGIAVEDARFYLLVFQTSGYACLYSTFLRKETVCPNVGRSKARYKLQWIPEQA